MGTLSQFRELINSKTAKDSFVLLLGNVVSAILGIIFTVLMARLLLPENWGLASAVLSLIPIFVAVADLGLGSAFFQYSAGKWQIAHTGIQRIHAKFFGARLVTICFFVLVFGLLLPVINKYVLQNQDLRLVVLAVLGFVIISLYDFQIFVNQAKRNWVLASVLISLSNVIRILLLLVLNSSGILNLFNSLLVFTLGPLLVFVLGLVLSPIVPDFSFGKLVPRFSQFSANMAVNKIVSTISSRIDVLLVIAFLGAYQAGVYSAANRLAMGVPLVMGSLATVFASRFAAISDVKELKRYFQKSFLMCFGISILLVLGIFISPWVINFLGEQYSDSTLVLQYLFVAMVPFVLSVPTVNILIYHFKKPNIIAGLSVAQLLITVTVIYLFLGELNILAPVVAIGLSNLLILIVTHLFTLSYLAQQNE